MSQERSATTESLNRPLDDAVPDVRRALIVTRVSVSEFRTNDRRCFFADDAFPNVCGPVVIRGQRVGLNASWHIRVSVPKPCRNCRKRYAAGKQDRRVSVA